MCQLERFERLIDMAALVHVDARATPAVQNGLEAKLLCDMKLIDRLRWRLAHGSVQAHKKALGYNILVAF